MINLQPNSKKPVLTLNKLTNSNVSSYWKFSYLNLKNNGLNDTGQKTGKVVLSFHFPTYRNKRLTLPTNDTIFLFNILLLSKNI